MSKNLIPRIAAMLGLQLGEEFNVVSKDGSERACRLTYGGLRVCGSNYSQRLLMDIVYGNVEIIKLHYRPDYRQMYWTFGLKDGIWVVVPREWEDYPAEILLADKGWTYRTREEAEDALPKVAAEMGVQYVL